MLYSIVSIGDFLTMCACVLCDWGRNVGEGDRERKVRVMGLGGLLSASLGLYTYDYLSLVVLEQNVHAIVTTVRRNKYKSVCVCVCVCVC